jgi:hypothetical protein
VTEAQAQAQARGAEHSRSPHLPEVCQLGLVLFARLRAMRSTARLGWRTPRAVPRHICKLPPRLVPVALGRGGVLANLGVLCVCARVPLAVSAAVASRGGWNM